MRTYAEAVESLQHVSVRVRRLFALACCEVVKPYIEKPVDHILETARRMTRPETFTDRLEIVSAQADAGQLHYPALRNAELYRAEVTSQLVSLCISDNVPWQLLATITWSIRCWQKEFDLKLCNDLDLMGNTRNSRRDKVLCSETTIGLAKACYGGDWDQRLVLADALEEFENLPESWREHLRAHDKHWEGCWVVDNILRRD